MKVLAMHPDGIRKDALIEASGWTAYHCAKALRTIAERGLAGPTRGGCRMAVWATAGNIALISAERERRAEARRLAAAARAAAALPKASKPAENAANEADFARPSVHRKASAGEWPSLPMRAPFSVLNV